MKRRSKSRPPAVPVCAEFYEDDGIDPRKYFKTRSSGDDRKTLQLCKQVAQTLRVVLSGEARESILRDLDVLSVSPAPDSSRLLVSLQLLASEQPFSRERIEDALKRAQPWLRSEVAAAVSRKRVPDLVFQVLPPEGRPDE